MDNLTVVVPFFNGHAYIADLLRSLPADLPVIVIDDQSEQPLQLQRRNTKVIRPSEKLYFTGAVNLATTLCTTDVLVLNQDVELHGTAWLDLLDQQRRDYALIGERIKGDHPAYPYGYVHGVFQYMRRDALTQVGPLDAANYPLWGATALWQWQICRQGFKALPLVELPGLMHKREGGFGSSIRQLLAQGKVDQSWLIRTPPAISVVIPCYNHGRYIRDAVNSLVGGLTPLGVFPPQTFQSFEVIVVDDGSDDGTTPAQVDAVADGWAGVRVYHTPNGGTAAAHNYGIARAVGKYITTMSADDLREPWSLEKLYQASVAYPHSLVYDNLLTFTNGGRGQLWKTLPYDFEDLLYKNMVPVGTMFERSAWEEVGGYPAALKYGREDWGFALAMGSHGYCGVKLDEAGYLYRREGQNRTLTNTTLEWRERFLSQMVELFPHLYKGERPMSCCGGKGSVPARSAKNAARMMAMSIDTMAGAEGMVMLEYIGKNYGSQQWGGPNLPSRKIYVFGGNPKDKRKLVDKRDAEWFLARRDHGQRLFKQVPLLRPEPVEPLPLAPPVVPPVQAAPVVVDVPALGVTAQERVVATPVVPGLALPEYPAEATLIDPTDLTIPQVLDQLAGKSPEYIEAVLVLEENGKQRKTLLAQIRDLLKDV